MRGQPFSLFKPLRHGTIPSKLAGGGVRINPAKYVYTNIDIYVTIKVGRWINMSPYSAILFARPSFLEGMGRIADLGGTLNEYNQSLHPDQADYLAVLADWYAVGGDLRDAMNTVMSQQEANLDANA
jgi:hypothetical protein